MAHPKRKISRTRRDKRRTHHKLEAKAVTDCKNCGAAVLKHHVCMECGYYMGRQILDIAAEEEV